MQDLEKLVAEATALFADIDNADALEQAKARYLGKSGALTELLKGLGKLPVAEKPAAGARINVAKQALEQALNEQRERIAERALKSRLSEESIDVSLPGRGRGMGGLHPVSRTMERIEQLFRSIGFDFGYFGYILMLWRRRKRQPVVLQYWRPISPTIRIAPARIICQTRFIAAMSRSRSLANRGSSEWL